MAKRPRNIFMVEELRFRVDTAVGLTVATEWAKAFRGRSHEGGKVLGF